MVLHSAPRTGEGGRFRRALHRLAAPQAELEAADLRQQVETFGATEVGSCPLRAAVCVSGTIRGVRMEARASAPVLAADVYDGSGTVTAVFLGRSRIGGIEPGRRVVMHGRIAVNDGRRVMYNPRYQLLPVDYRCSGGDDGGEV